MKARSEVVKERCMKGYKEGKRKFKRCIHQSKEEMNGEFERKMNHDVGIKVESYGKIKEGKGRLVAGEDEVRRTWIVFLGIYII